MFGVKVIKTGMVVSLQKPWISASPDGIFLDKNGALCLLEIKCPFSMKDMDAIHVPYIVNNQLKKKHSYFTQVQLTMFASGIKTTHFYVFGLKASCHIIVEYDEKYC